MADTDGQLIIGIELDDGTIKKVQADANKLAEAIGGNLSEKINKGVDSSFVGFKAKFDFIREAGSKAFEILAEPIKRAVEEASHAQANLSLFNNVLANAGAYSKAASEDFQTFAESLAHVGTVSADSVIAASTSLVSIGNLTGDALKKATQSAVDLSAGLGVDLNTSFNLVAKAAEGNVGALRRYGILVDTSLPKTQQFADTLQKINERFGGLDVSKANTFAGAFTRLQNTINEAYQAVGSLVTGSAPLVGLFKSIGTIIERLTEQFKGLKGQNLFDQFVKGAINAGNALTQVLLPPLEVLYNSGVVIFDFFKTALQGVVALLGQFGAGLGSIGSALGILSDSTAQSLNTFAQSSQDVLVQFANQTATAVGDVFKTNLSDAVIPTLNEINDAVQNAAPIDPLVNNVVDGANRMSAAVLELKKKLNDMINQAMVKGLSQGVQAVVGALLKGGNAFKAFLGSVLNIMGDLAIQIGETLLLTGLGIDAVRDSIIGLTGGPAIAAGIALIAFGALLKSLTGGGGSTASAGGGGGAAASSSTAATKDVASAGDPNAVASNKQTQVNINVSGNILDRRESGLEISKIIQDYFDTNDGVISKA